MAFSAIFWSFAAGDHSRERESEGRKGGERGERDGGAADKVTHS